MPAKPWILRVLLTGPESVSAEWLAGHLAPVLAPYFELSPRFTRVEVPIREVRSVVLPGGEYGTPDAIDVAYTDGLFNEQQVFYPATARVFTGFSWVLTEKQPVVRGSGRISQSAPNDVRAISRAVGARLATVVGDQTNAQGELLPSRTGFEASGLVIKKGEPLSPPLGEIPDPPEGGGWGWWLAGGALALLAGWAIFGRKRRGKASKARRLP